MKLLRFSLLPLLSLLAACSLGPRATPAMVQHDLGSGFRTLARKPVPVRALSLSATPVVAGLTMNYREADHPTLRGAYAFNRWAAPPANLLEQALSRLLPTDYSGRCRLSFQLSDFILDLDANGQAAALLAGSLRISLDGRNVLFKRIVDIRVPVERASPEQLAVGQRRAVVELAEQTSAWLSTPELDSFCQPDGAVN